VAAEDDQGGVWGSRNDLQTLVCNFLNTGYFVQHMNTPVNFFQDTWSDLAHVLSTFVCVVALAPGFV
jgi:hypothetical protein